MLAIRRGDPHALEQIYLDHREPFIAWLLKTYRCDPEEAVDFYQATILSFYDNVLQGKLTELTGSLRTYLFAIGRNKWREHHRRRQRYSLQGELSAWQIIDPEDSEDDQDVEIRKLQRGLRALGDPCQKLLEAFYYQGLKLDDLVDVFGYKTKEAARTAKYKCMQRLRKLVA